MTSAAQQRLSRSNLGETVYLRLWQRILTRSLQPGDKLSDLQLSRELGVSRTPVREALQRLVSDGIVRSEPNRGFFVASFSQRDIAEIYDLRAALEVMALKQAAARLSPDEIDSEQQEFAEVETMVRDAATDEQWLESTRRFLESDRAFHRRLAERAGNTRLQAILEGLWAQIAVFQRAGLFRRSWLEIALRDHRLILAALHAKQTDQAAALLEGHIIHVKELVLDLAEH